MSNDTNDMTFAEFETMCKDAGIEATHEEMMQDYTVGGVMADLVDELMGAMEKFPPMNSAHEGFSVLHEELDELWEHVKAKQGARDIAAMRKEAIQVAAMAVRFAADICREDRTDN